jgi:type IV pilus assembly protein PilA
MAFLSPMLVRNYLLKFRANDGFTLIELLVVIIIIGVLSAIALPSFLNQANKARESEAKIYIGSINRAQQAYYHENLSSFADSLDKLGIGVPAQTGHYQYQISSPKVATESEVKALPIPGQQINAYQGCVAIVVIKSGGPTVIDPANPVNECSIAGTPASGGGAPTTSGGGGAPVSP